MQFHRNFVAPIPVLHNKFMSESFDEGGHYWNKYCHTFAAMTDVLLCDHITFASVMHWVWLCDHITFASVSAAGALPQHRARQPY